jgi:hypothetical protein
MSNALLTTDLIADRALQIFSEKASFLNTINRQYDDTFAKRAPKIGDTLRVAVPQHSNIVSGRVAQPTALQTLVRNVVIQDQTQFSVTYNSSEMALDIEEFSRRYLDQQVADLVVNIEADAQVLAYQATPNQTGTPDGQWTNLSYANMARKLIEDNGGFKGTKQMLINNAAEMSLINAQRTYFNPTPEIAKQYNEGFITRASGFDWTSTTVAPVHQRGTANASYTVNGATESGSAITIQAGSGTILVGDIVTFAGAVAVHPQTKQSLGYLRQFVVTANLSGAGDLSIYPALTVSGSEQNVTGYPTNGGAVVILGTASDTYGINLAYTPDAFTFVTVDLPDLPGLPCSRRKYENVSMRVATGSDITNDSTLMRFDIMWGFGALRPEFACRVANDPANLTPA